MTSKNYFKIITSIYQKYQPEKVSNVTSLLEKYNGHEEELLESIYSKYSVSVNEKLGIENSVITERAADKIITEDYNKKGNKKYRIAIILLIIVAIGVLFWLFQLNNKSDDNAIFKDQNSNISLAPTPEILQNELKELSYDNFIAFHNNPKQTYLLTNSGYKQLSLFKNGEEQIFVGVNNDTIRSFYTSIVNGDSILINDGYLVWNGNKTQRSFFEKIEAGFKRNYKYYKEEFNDLVGDDTNEEIYSDYNTYIGNYGIEYVATIVFDDKMKTHPQKYIIYIGNSE